MRARTWLSSIFKLWSTLLAQLPRANKTEPQIAPDARVACARIRPSENLAICLFVILVATSGCGGGGNSSSNPTPPPTPTPAPDFTLSASPAQVNIGLGFAQNVTVSVAQSGSALSAPIAVTIGGLPSGVTAAPSTFNLSVGGSQTQTVALAASSSAAIGTVTITVQGISGTLSHSTSVSLTTEATVSAVHAPIRTRALRTDASPAFTAYDAAHRQFFISNPNLNKIDVFDAVQEVETAAIPVSGPLGLDVSPYDGNLYVGTVGGDVYVIDTGTLSVAKRYPASTIGPSGFEAAEALALSGGLLALENLNFSSGSISVVVWDPATNTLDYGPSNSSGAPSICFPVAGSLFPAVLALSGDRSRILMATLPYASPQACSYDPIARQTTIEPIPYQVSAIAPTPDGQRFFAIVTNPVSLLSIVAAFDAKTLQLLGQNAGPFVWNGASPEFGSGVISTDGNTLYVSDLVSGEVGAFNTTTLAQTGWVPGNLGVTGAIDQTGLLVGPISSGVGFLDAALPQPNEPSYVLPAFPDPATGPLSGGTLLSGIASATVKDGATLNQIYIGNTPALGSSFPSGTDQQNVANATTPLSDFAGAVDTTVTLSDGGVMTCTECFSYGPSIIELVSNGSTADGGGTGLLVGYGFGAAGGYSGPNYGVSVTIGGQPAKVLASLTQSGANGGVPYPFNSDELIFSIPPGTAETAADLTVTTSSGSTTASGAFHFVAAAQTFPLADTLQQGIYDAGRDLYYFAGKSQIEVLSQTSGKWLPAISLPGVTSSSQLVAIAESPDGSKLAVSDEGGQAIYLLDPDNPASAARFSLLPSATGSQVTEYPNGLAVTNAGTVYYTTEGPAYPFLMLNTSTGQVTPIGQAWGGVNPCQSCRVVQSSDGTRIYGNLDGIAFWADPLNDQVILSSFGWGLSGAFPDLTISGDGSTVDIESSFADSSINFESRLAYSDWEWLYPGGLPDEPTPAWIATSLAGKKLNGDGSILFIPLNNGIDLYARNTGRLLYRIGIPVTPASVFDPLVIGKGTNVLAVITADGVSVIDMSSLPIAAGLTQPFPEVTRTSSRIVSSNSSDGLAGQRGTAALSRSTGIKRVLEPRHAFDPYETN
jgi:hypothetical protein